MSPRQLSPGDHIESHCTRCRTLMNHTLIALVDGRPVRVKCNTCGGEHAYRAPKPAPRTPAERAPRQSSARIKSDPAAALRQQWETLLAGHDPATATPYRMDASFKVNTLVRHPSFGLGLVQQVGDRKMEVVFAEGTKVLRCG